MFKKEYTLYQRTKHYSLTSIKRSPLGLRKRGHIRQVSSSKRFNSYEIFYDRTRKRWPFNTGDCLIEVTAWAGLTVYHFQHSIGCGSLYIVVSNSYCVGLFCFLCIRLVDSFSGLSIFDCPFGIL